jgi:hyperosmotically inducible periplasmic protein
VKFNVRVGLAGMLIATLALLSGCQAYRTGEGRTAGQLTDDVSIQSLVKLGLLNDPDIKGLNVKTTVRRGVVTLSGRVGSQEQKQRAVAIAHNVKGVERVDDRLSIVTE